MKGKEMSENIFQSEIFLGGLMVASTTVRVTLVTAAAATATALHLVKLRSTKICVYDN